MDMIKNPRRVETVRVDTVESPILMSDYKQKIVGDIYLTVNEFEGENYNYIRKFFVDRDGHLRAKKDGCLFNLSRYAIFIDKIKLIEPRFWAMEEGMSVRPYEIFIGPWKLSVNIFGYISVFKYNYDSATDQLLPSNKGISFPLDSYRPLARQIFNLLEHLPNLKDLRPCYETIHSKSAKCDTCDPFEKFRVKPKPDDTVCHIAS